MSAPKSAISNKSPSHRPVIVAGASVRSLAESALRIGWPVYAVDLFQDYDLQRLYADAELGDEFRLHIPDYEAIPDALSEIPSDVPFIPTGGVECLQEQIAAIAQHRPVCRMPASAIEALRNPDVLFPSLQTAGFQVPDFITLRRNSMTHLPAGRWLKKDRFSSGGQGVAQVDSGLKQEQLNLHDGRCFFQREIDGISMSATFLADSTSHCYLLGCTRQISGCRELNASGFDFCGNMGPIFPGPQTTDSLQQLGRFVCEQWPVRGLWGLDFILNPEGMWPLEINPRITASHFLFDDLCESGSLMREHCRAFEDRVPLLKRPSLDRYTARLVVYTNRNLTFQQQHLQECVPFLRRLNDPASGFVLSDLPNAGTTIPKGAPLCSINLSGLTETELVTSLKQNLPNVSVLNQCLDMERLAGFLQCQATTF